jgi:polysaccharide export outer membrane protein
MNKAFFSASEHLAKKSNPSGMDILERSNMIRLNDNREKRMRMFSINSFVRILMVSLLFSSCISQKKVMLLQDKNAAVKNNFVNKKKTTYQIQSGDHLYIRIYSLDPKTSKFFQTDLPTLMNPTYVYLNSYMVDEEGYINFSLVERVLVRGLTIEEVKKKIQKSLNEYFNETTVVVKLVNFQIVVLGEVNSPGNFTIDKDQINVLQAIALAGGIKDFGNNRKITLVRQTLKGSDIFYLDLSDKNILESDYFYLMPNDFIYVSPSTNKSFAFSTFPYSLIFSIASFALSILIFLKIN